MSVMWQLPTDILHSVYGEWLRWEDLSRLDVACVEKTDREVWLSSLNDLRKSRGDVSLSDAKMRIFSMWLVNRKVLYVEEFPVSVSVLEDLVGGVLDIMESYTLERRESTQVQGSNDDWAVCLSHVLRRRQYKHVTLRLRKDYYMPVGILKPLLEPYQIHLSAITSESCLFSLLRDLPHLNSLYLVPSYDNQCTDATLAAITEHAKSLTKLDASSDFPSLLNFSDTILTELIKSYELIEYLDICCCGLESLVAVSKHSSLSIVHLNMAEKDMLDGLLLDEKVKWPSTPKEGRITSYTRSQLYGFIKNLITGLNCDFSDKIGGSTRTYLSEMNDAEGNHEQVNFHHVMIRDGTSTIALLAAAEGTKHLFSLCWSTRSRSRGNQKISQENTFIINSCGKKFLKHVADEKSHLMLSKSIFVPDFLETLVDSVSGWVVCLDDNGNILIRNRKNNNHTRRIITRRIRMTDLVQYIGLDFGGQKTIVVAEDAEIIRTTTGSVARPSLLSFSNGRRVFGDEASAQITAEYTLPLLSMMIGRTLEEVRAQPWYSQLRVPVQADSEGRLFLTINHDIELEQQQSETETTVVDESNRFYVTSLVAMYLAQIVNQIQSEQKAKPDDTAPTAAVGEEGTTNTTTPNSTLRYVLTAFTPNASIYNNWIQACRIAGLEEKQVVLVDPTQSLVAAYARKIAGLGGPEAAGVMGKNVLLVDVGHCQTSVVLVTYEPPAAVPEGGNSDAMVLPKVLNKAYSDAFGAYFYDLLLFNHFQTMIQEKYKTTVEPGTRKSLRLLLACERVRKLLSQLPEGIVTVENICENADINLRITREEFASCCQSLNTLFHEMINDCKKGEESVGLDYVIDSVEVSGGGCRMPHIQNLLLNLLANNNQGTGNAILGAKLDDSSNALGGVLCVKNYNQFTAPVEVTSDDARSMTS
eukprot:scaffold1755_cov258-Ochromonas_danica.AAC.11